MDRAKQVHQAIKVFLPFTPDESARFRGFLKATGRKAGPWVRTLALAAMDREEGKGDGSVQAREMAQALEQAR